MCTSRRSVARAAAIARESREIRSEGKQGKLKITPRLRAQFARNRGAKSIDNWVDFGPAVNDTIRSAAASMIHSQHCSPKAWQHFHGDPRPICSRGRRENPPKSMPRTTARHALDPGAGAAGAAGTPNHRFCIARVPRRPELRIPDSLVDLSSGLRRQNGRARAIFHRFRHQYRGGAACRDVTWTKLGGPLYNTTLACTVSSGH